MKRILKKRDWGIVLLALILSITAILTVQKNKEKKIVGNWELVGSCKDNALLFGDFGEFIYFNLSLSEEGTVNVVSYPERFTGVGTYCLYEKNKNIYDYAANLHIYRTNGDVDPFGVKLTYNIKNNLLIMFYSEDDGFIFKKTKQMTTIKEEIILQSYVGRYVAGGYFKYENYYEKSINIKYVTDKNIVFDICYKNKFQEDKVVAVKNEYGYYYFEFLNTYCCGYIFFEGENVVIDITNGGGVIEDHGKTTYTRVGN